MEGDQEAQQVGGPCSLILHNMYVSSQANISRTVSIGGFVDVEMMTFSPTALVAGSSTYPRLVDTMNCIFSKK